MQVRTSGELRPLAGVQLTRGGGYAGFESPDGKSLVYTLRSDRSGTPLLTVPLAGGRDTQLRDCVYGFSVGSRGVYYYPCRPDAFAWTMTQSTLWNSG